MRKKNKKGRGWEVDSSSQEPKLHIVAIVNPSPLPHKSTEACSNVVHRRDGEVLAELWGENGCPTSHTVLKRVGDDFLEAHHHAPHSPRSRTHTYRQLITRPLAYGCCLLRLVHFRLFPPWYPTPSKRPVFFFFGASCLPPFLPALAAVRMGAAARWSHALYPSQARGTLGLRQWPLEEGPPEPPHEYERMEWVTSHAMTLARFLRQLPELDSLKLRDRATATSCTTLRHILGQALLMLPPRPRLSEINLDELSYDYETNTGESLLVLAIVAGKTPGLRVLSATGRGDLTILDICRNTKLVASSIEMGHLPCLTHLQIWAADLPTFLDAYKRRHERGEPQAMVEALEVVNYFDWEDEDPRFLRELLLLPSFGQLQVLDCRLKYYDDVEGLLGTLAVYVLHTEGAPCLRYLSLPYCLDSSPLGLRFKPLFDRGFANLTSLHFPGIRANAVEQLGSIYRGGGLAKLEKLTFGSIVFDDQTMAALMDAVLTWGCTPRVGCRARG